MTQHSKIALIGGNGKAGRYITEKALQDGYHVRMLVRNPDRYTISDERIEKVKGDAQDLASIRSLLEGCHTVVNVVGQPKKGQSIFSTVTSHILSVMKETETNRYIAVTGGSVDAPGDKKNIINKIGAKMFHLFFPDMMIEKQKELKILLQSEANWTLVRLPFVLEGPATGKIRESLTDMPGMTIRNTDIAEFLIDQIKDTRYIRKTPFIAN
ncbi:NAD(P)-dependent oxidoreductase [Risungbinella massiliensis]|uniref:NAD(P)-dependent oxidoreductase n=1 Tax=Risungbinella massiliensis TaxID=1329796 RepID=UPI0005CBB2BC|nr:SDR family oxidoreductase [Risungbinella massiliensis]